MAWSTTAPMTTGTRISHVWWATPHTADTTIGRRSSRSTRRSAVDGAVAMLTSVALPAYD